MSWDWGNFAIGLVIGRGVFLLIDFLWSIKRRLPGTGQALRDAKRWGLKAECKSLIAMDRAQEALRKANVRA
jgi:hypothetical protein